MTYGFFLGPNERALTGPVAVGGSPAGMIGTDIVVRMQTRAANKHYLSEFKPAR
jgi:hypothetical protein